MPIENLRCQLCQKGFYDCECELNANNEHFEYFDWSETCKHKLEIEEDMLGKEEVCTKGCGYRVGIGPDIWDRADD